MTVDFVLAKAPAYRVATLPAKGGWSENVCRPEFAKLLAWAEKNGLQTGKWIFRGLDNDGFQACLEIRGTARASGAVRIRTLPASAVARVRFDPDLVSPRVVYHGLNDWLRWRKKEKEIRAVRSTREIYDGDPWTDTKAWKNTTVEFLVSR
ncbi:MAG: GyrI-like domain-containing protein [Thermoplasmata archaeon]|nr:GyrI-like domain-containing protein [Thermoplasmata archaeon]